MPRVKAVLDTNVIVSALLKPEGRQALLLDLALSGSFTTIASRDLLQEYEEVLRRPRFALDPRGIAGSMRAIRKAGVLVQPRRHLRVTGDPDDNMVLECALEGGAEYVVTGNTRDFPREFQGFQIVPPRKFMTVRAVGVETFFSSTDGSPAPLGPFVFSHEFAQPPPTSRREVTQALLPVSYRIASGGAACRTARSGCATCQPARSGCAT